MTCSYCWQCNECVCVGVSLTSPLHVRCVMLVAAACARDVSIPVRMRVTHTRRGRERKSEEKKQEDHQGRPLHKLYQGSK
ncbi:hypothetical protein TRSC58_07631 [Trypanosoma rangeli SC58]|uniref:Uncharacterized protein n=1 Tax=Trypanosoma rangeli SC58 TaxID=429131 RepID=A0A061IUU1_TRYRA|nr:hypothetical protein TRSC58_07631 [Trypanosoma rangeli SC58]